MFPFILFGSILLVLIALTLIFRRNPPTPEVEEKRAHICCGGTCI